MAVILYANGLTEEFKPQDLVFTEQEILNIFKEFDGIITVRPINIINCWCVFAKNYDSLDFNRLASDIIEQQVYSHALFIHDSEINPDWKITDSILYKNYKEFIFNLKTEFDLVALNIVEEYSMYAEQQGNVDSLPQLDAIGSTNDKRLLFSFNPDIQSKEFYSNQEFLVFSQKVLTYLLQNIQKKEPFTIYEDKKAIIIIENKRVQQFIETMIEKFKSTENYEACTQLTKISDNWKKTILKPKRKPRAPKNNDKNLNGK